MPNFERCDDRPFVRPWLESLMRNGGVALCWEAVMPQSIPPGLKKEHVDQALNNLDSGIDHPFGDPTGYELVHGDKRYDPESRHRFGLSLLPGPSLAT